jgi:hypothetical protein
MWKPKAEAMSLNMIIMAAIGLVVMIVLIMIFTGSIGKWKKSTESCEIKKGVCVSDEQDADSQYIKCNGYYASVLPYTCEGEHKICCFKTINN